MPLFPLHLSAPLGSSTSSASIEDAIRTWVIAGSNLDPTLVYFQDQKVDRPDRATGIGLTSTFVTIRLDSVVSLGAVDALTTHFDATRAAGTEIEQRVDGERSITARVQVWGAPTVDTVGAPSAVQVARRIRTALRLPSVRDALRDAGLSPYDVGPAQNLGQLLGTDFDGRASLDVGFYFHETMSEYTGYIATVNLTNTDTGATHTVST